ncbi:hypothetical protein O9929_25455 [Vibrio lentus]|nr:hypothetical protein [Vibrio lentus]
MKKFAIATLPLLLAVAAIDFDYVTNVTSDSYQEGWKTAKVELQLRISDASGQGVVEECRQRYQGQPVEQ